jgi:hypothetical protein
MKENAIKVLAGDSLKEERYNGLLKIFLPNTKKEFLKRKFNKGYSKDNLSSLEFEIKQLFGIKYLEIVAAQELLSNDDDNTDKAVLPGGSLPPKPKPKTVEAEAEDMEPIRKEFPFLNDENCPEVLLIAVGRKITAYNKEKEINARILELRTKAKSSAISVSEDEELKLLAEKAIHYFNENEKLYKELKHYGETGEILGEHELFAEYAFKKEVDAMNTQKLIAYQNSSKKFFSLKNKELEKADELKALEIQKAIELRQIKLNMVNKKLGV